MNRVKIVEANENVQIELSFESLEVAREFFTNEECINDVLSLLCNDEQEEELPDNDMFRASVMTQACETSTKTLEAIKEFLEEELSKRK